MRIPPRYAIALTAALGMLMGVLDNTIVNVALVPMAQALNANLGAIQWVVTGYFLAQAAVIPVAGYFGNRFGIKRLFILALVAFTLGSLLCGLARNEAMLIVFRVVQGLGGGALFPLGQAIVFGAFERNERAAASALISIPILLAPAFGPTLGGWLTVAFSWEAIFLINIPVGVLAVWMANRILPADNLPAQQLRSRFDYTGLILCTLGVMAVVFAFTLVSEPQPGTQTPLNPQGTLYGWGYWLVWALLGLGVVLLAAFAVYELRHDDPVLDLRIFTHSDFTLSSLVTWLISVVIFGSLLLLPIFLQQVRLPNLNALDAGLALMPQGLAAAVGITISGQLYNRLGVRNLVLIGAALLLFSSWELSRLTPSTSGWDMLPWLVLRGLGFGMSLIPVQTRALEAVSGPALAKASSLFNVTRQIASSIGVAAVVTLFVQRSAVHMASLQTSLPPGSTPDLSSPAAQAALAQMAAQAGTSATNDVFMYVTWGCAILLLLSLVLPGRSRYGEASTSDHSVRPVLSE